MMQMGFQFQEIVGGSMRYRYEKLSSSMMNEKMARRGSHWVKQVNGRLKGLRLCRSRKLTLKVFSVVVSSSRITRIYSEVVNRMKIDGVCPNINFSTQWGLPVLSHPSLQSRKRVFNIDRKLKN